MYEVFTSASPVTYIIKALLLIVNRVYGLPWISSAFLTSATHPFAWIPSNITSANLAALGRNLTTGMDSPHIDTPATTTDSAIPTVASPGTGDQVESPSYV